MDAWRRFSYSMYHSGVKLAMRSQPRSKYPRHACLKGRTEPCSVWVIDSYNQPMSQLLLYGGCLLKV